MSNKKDYAEKYPTLQNFIMNCQVTEKDYSTPKVIAYLSDVNKYSAILSELSFHIVLERECREIIMLLTEPEKTSKAKLATTSSTGGLSLALQRAIITARPKGRYRKHFYWPAIKRYYWNLLFSIPLLAHLYISELLHLLYCRLFQHNIL